MTYGESLADFIGRVNFAISEFREANQDESTLDVLKAMIDALDDIAHPLCEELDSIDPGWVFDDDEDEDDDEENEWGKFDDSDTWEPC